jgi:hypothetical protein
LGGSGPGHGVGNDLTQRATQRLPELGTLALLGMSVAALLRYRDRGISHVQVALDALTVEGIEEFAGVLDAIDRALPGGSSAEQSPVH